MYRVFPSVINKCLFQDCLSSIALFSQKNSILRNLKSKHAVHPSADMRQLCQYVSYEFIQSTMWPEALLYINFTLLAHAPNNHACRLHISVPLQCYCSLYTDPTLLHIQVITRTTMMIKITMITMTTIITATTMTLNYHAITICANKNMFLKCHICLLVHVQIWDNCVSINTSHEVIVINNSTTSTGIYFTLLAYTSEEICLPHCICMSHCTATLVYV